MTLLHQPETSAALSPISSDFIPTENWMNTAAVTQPSSFISRISSEKKPKTSLELLKYFQRPKIDKTRSAPELMNHLGPLRQENWIFSFKAFLFRTFSFPLSIFWSQGENSSSWVSTRSAECFEVSLPVIHWEGLEATSPKTGITAEKRSVICDNKKTVESEGGVRLSRAVRKKILEIACGKSVSR